MTNPESIAALLSLLRERQSFLITSHARPDGDAIGSSVGLMHLLEGMGKSVTVVFADPIPIIYQYLPGIDHIVHELPETPPDCAILLECGSVERSGFEHIPAKFSINIDHHQSSLPFADFNWIDARACAVGAMVYDLAVASGVHISSAMATCLYTAVLTDTGSFTYTSTDESTFALAEHLVSRGADPNAIANAVYFSNPVGKIRLLGIALANMKIDGCVAWSTISVEEMERAGAVVEDSEGIVNYLIGMAEIQAAAFLREFDREQIRLSLRSKNGIDVAKVAERFQGGGHKNASGCTLPTPLAGAVETIVEALRRACKG